MFRPVSWSEAPHWLLPPQRRSHPVMKNKNLPVMIIKEVCLWWFWSLEQLNGITIVCVFVIEMGILYSSLSKIFILTWVKLKILHNKWQKAINDIAMVLWEKKCIETYTMSFLTLNDPFSLDLITKTYPKPNLVSSLTLTDFLKTYLSRKTSCKKKH